VKNDLPTPWPRAHATRPGDQTTKGSIQYLKKTSGGKWKAKTWLPLPGWPGYQVRPAA